jgi:hypothetical protein
MHPQKNEVSLQECGTARDRYANGFSCQLLFDSFF